jgi:hypothetical protein
VLGEFISDFSEGHNRHNRRKSGQFTLADMARSDVEASGATRG